MVDFQVDYWVNSYTHLYRETQQKKSTKQIQNEDSNIKDLLKSSEIREEVSSSEQSTSIESSILKKIK